MNAKIIRGECCERLIFRGLRSLGYNRSVLEDDSETCLVMLHGLFHEVPRVWVHQELLDMFCGPYVSNRSKADLCHGRYYSLQPKRGLPGWAALILKALGDAGVTGLEGAMMLMWNVAMHNANLSVQLLIEAPGLSWC